MMITFTDSDYAKVRRRKGKMILGKGPNDIGTAEWIVGGISKPSKMPGPSYNLTTSVCHIGGMLRKVKGSVCEGCYADGRGRYGFDSVYDAGMRRLSRVRQALKDDRFRALYIEAFVALLNGGRGPKKWMRWHDAGDIISVAHVILIIDIAVATPQTDHWLPSKEYGRILQALAIRSKPANLAIRISGYMVDEAAPIVADGLVTSTVTTTGNGKGHSCPAVENHTSCNGIPMADPKADAIHPACRACWDNNVANVDYGLHTATVTTPDAADSERAAEIWGKQTVDSQSLQKALEQGTPVAV
jgi:hypothetical protein